MNNQQKQQVLEQIKSANNVLVTVSANPTVDELAASVGLTLALNKMGKHATTVFSGVVPSTIEFLQPEQTIETTTDSLRDFIIALDKSKADKLRYKVENDVVRIFITPYKTKITDKDLEFSHGDFNVDVVIAIGVTKREDLDQAVTAHGRILHDATVVSITRQEGSELGSINWQDPQASSLCEMVASVTIDAKEDVLDGQMATAFLTGIIAETDRFRNEKTSPLSLSLSSQLMSSGANQQLIAEKLEEPEAPPAPLHQADEEPEKDQEVSEDGTLSINHHDDNQDKEEDVDKIHIDEHGNLGPHDEEQNLDSEHSPLVLPDDYSEHIEENFSEENHQKNESGPTLPQPEPSKSTMQHEKIITPPSEEGMIKTDKPFDLNAAIQAANNQGIPVEAAPDETELPEPEQEPELTLPKQEPAEPPKIIQEHAGPMLTEPPQTQVQEDSAGAEYEQPSGVPNPNAPGNSMADSRTETTEPQINNKPPDTNVGEEPPKEKPKHEQPKEEHSMLPPQPVVDEQTLTDLEKAVESPHLPSDDSLDAARSAVASAAEAQAPSYPKAAESTGAQNVDLQEVAKEVAQSAPENTNPEDYVKPEVHDSTAPPAVPPPMTTPVFYDEQGNNQNPFLNPNH